jgi:hypothetical protein
VCLVCQVLECTEGTNESAGKVDVDAVDMDAIKAGDGSLPGGLDPDSFKQLASNPEVGNQTNSGVSSAGLTYLSIKSPCFPIAGYISCVHTGDGHALQPQGAGTHGSTYGWDPR